MRISRERRNQPEPDGGQAQPGQGERMRGDDAPDRQVVRPGQDIPGQPDTMEPRGDREMRAGHDSASADQETRPRHEVASGDPRPTPEDPDARQRAHAGTQPEHEVLPPGGGAARSASPEHRRARADIPAAQSNPRTMAGQSGGNGGERVLADADLGRLRDQWREVQTMFVDDPRDAVTRANGLVEGTIQQLTESYAQRRQALENRWARSDRDDTEELRQALRGYRQLFDQLLETAGAATNM